MPHRPVACRLRIWLLVGAITMMLTNAGVRIYAAPLAQEPPPRAESSLKAQADQLEQEARALHRRGDRPGALDKLKQALSLYRRVGDREREALMLNNLGLVYDELGEKRQALDYYHQALPLNRAVDNRRGEVTTLSNLGAIYSDLGEKQQALDYLNQALSLSHAIGDRDGEATALNNLGLVSDSLGEKERALAYYRQALLLWQALGDRANEATILNNLGGVYDSLGEKHRALAHYQQALSLRQAGGDRAGEAATLNNLGWVYDSLGEKQQALARYQQALSLRRAVGDRAGEAKTLNLLGLLYDSLGERQRALAFYHQALQLSRTVRDRQVEAAILNNLGRVYDDAGEKQQALDYYQQALPLSRAIGDRAGEAALLNNLGLVYDGLGERQKVLAYYHQALLLWRAIGDHTGESSTLSNLGYWHENQSDFRQALDFYLQAIAAHEEVRTAVRLEEFKTKLAEQSTDVYQRAIRLHIRLGQPAQAFYLSERARARTFLDQLGNAHLNLRQGANAQLIAKEQKLRDELSALESRLNQERNQPQPRLIEAAILSITTQLSAKQREYKDLLIHLKLTNPEYASLRSVEPLKLPEVQRLLDKETTLLDYFVRPDKTLAFVITRQSLQTVELKMSEQELENAISWFRDFASLDETPPQSLQQLYSWLIAPLKAHLKTHLIGVIPHGILHYLPFAALTDGRRYFGDDYTLFHLPSASTLPFIQHKRKGGGGSVLALAHSQPDNYPRLPYADDEVRSIAKLYQTQAVVGRAATKAALRAQADKSKILHFAAHSELNTASPLFSRIILAPDPPDDGSLEVQEVYGLDLAKANLVVLSACQTLLGERSRGDDIVGLNRAFIYAGTPTVIASLWKVDDEATGMLMKSFYTHLKRGMSKAAALQAAQRETRAKPQYAHPYYWAAFVLTGDPGTNVAARKLAGLQIVN